MQRRRWAHTSNRRGSGPTCIEKTLVAAVGRALQLVAVADHDLASALVRDLVRRGRQGYDAVMTGAGTAIAGEQTPAATVTMPAVSPAPMPDARAAGNVAQTPSARLIAHCRCLAIPSRCRTSRFSWVRLLQRFSGGTLGGALPLAT